MNFKKLMLISLLFIAILTIGAASATDDVNTTDEALQDDSQSLPIEDSSDSDKLESTDEDCLSGISLDEFNDGDEYEIGNDEENTISVEIYSENDITGKLYVYIDQNPASFSKFNEGGGYFYVYENGNDGSVDITDANDPTICIDKVSKGEHVFRIVFEGPSSEFSIDKTATIIIKGKGDVSHIDIELADDDKYFYNRSGNVINITAPEYMINSLNITIDGQSYQLNKISATKGYVDISQLDVGDHQIIVNGGIQSENATFEVKKDTENPVNEGEIAYPNNNEFLCGAQKYISLKLPKNATGNLLIKDEYENVFFNQPLVNGEARFSLADLKVGEYSLIASYTGEDYDVDEEAIQLRINPIVSAPSRMVVGKNEYITVDFVHKDSGTIRFFVDYDLVYEAYFTGKDKVYYSLANLDDGDFELYVEFLTDEGYLFESQSYSIEILEVNPKIVGGRNIVMNYGDSKVYKFTIYGRNGKPAEEDEYVEIRIGKEIYDASTNSHGVVTFKIPNSVTPGKYKIVVDYDDTIYAKNVLVVKRILKLNKVNVRTSAEKLVIKATLKKKMKNKPIIFKFNGKKYVVKTNNKGVAKLIIKSKVLKKLKVGKKVKYQATYLKDTVKYSVKVKK